MTGNAIWPTSEWLPIRCYCSRRDSAYQDAGKLDLSLPLFKENILATEGKLGDRSSRHGRHHGLLGSLLAGTALHRGRAAASRVPGHPEALDGLIELYTATNKPEEVKKWQADRAKYPEGKPTEKK